MININFHHQHMPSAFPPAGEHKVKCVKLQRHTRKCMQTCADNTLMNNSFNADLGDSISSDQGRKGALRYVRMWEGLAQVITLSLCLSVFKPVQHASQPSPPKQHTDAQQHPRGITQTHRENRKRIYRCKHSSASLLFASLL